MSGGEDAVERNPDASAAEHALGMIDDADEFGAEGQEVGDGGVKAERFDAQREAEQQAMRELVSKGLSVLGEVLARSRGAHWRLSQAECDLVAGPAVEVLDKYDLESGPEVRLAMALGGIALPRLMAEAKKPKGEISAAEVSDGE